MAWNPNANPRLEEEMEARITSVQYGPTRRASADRLENLTDSIVRIMVAVGLGAVGIVFIGILIIGG